MGWFEAKTEKPKIPPAKALWAICPKCKSHFEKKVWKDNNSICPKCNYHGRLAVRERIAQVADKDSFTEVFREVSYSDHLNFHDATGAYKPKVEATIARLGETESVVMGTCTIEGHAAMLGVMDFSFMGGSLGTGTGERIARACEQAIAEKRPLIIFCACAWVVKQTLTIFAPTPGVVYVCQMLQCASYAVYVPAGVEFVGIVLPENLYMQGQAFLGAAFALGCLPATLLGGKLLDSVGLKSTLITFAVLLSVGAALFIVAAVRSRKTVQ